MPNDFEESKRKDLALKEATANKGRSSLLSLQAMKERYLKMGVRLPLLCSSYLQPYSSYVRLTHHGLFFHLTGP
jgi:hypothetical protein